MGDEGPGKLKNGFHMVAKDLDRAFASALLGGYESLVLQHVREGCWATPMRSSRKGDPKPDPTPFVVNLTQLSRDTGMCRQALSRAFNQLGRSNILARHDDGSVLINKDYGTWVFPKSGDIPESPRFSSTQLDYIRSAIDKIESQGCNKSASPPATKALHPLQQKRFTPCNKSASPPATKALHPHIEERGRGNSDNKTEEDNNTVVDPSRLGMLKAEMVPEYPAGDGGMHDIAPGHHPMEPEKAKAIFGLLWDAFRNQKFCYEFYARQESFPAEVWKSAIKAAKLQNVSVGSLNYIETIAKNPKSSTARQPALRVAEAPKTIPMLPPCTSEKYDVNSPNYAFAGRR